VFSSVSHEEAFQKGFQKQEEIIDEGRLVDMVEGSLDHVEESEDAGPDVLGAGIVSGFYQIDQDSGTGFQNAL
jgi:hypothetical protein